MYRFPTLLLIFLAIHSLVLCQHPLPGLERITISPGQVYDLTQARKHPENLFDGDTTSPAFTDFLNGFIIKESNGQVAWVVLDSFVNHPVVAIFNAQYASGGLVGFQFFYDWTDTTRHSPVYATTLPYNSWKLVEDDKSRQYNDSVRLMKLRIADGGSNNFMEVRLFANKLGPAPSILPAPQPEPPDEGKYFMGYGKLFTDTLMDDAGYSQRAQSDMDYIDTARDFSDGRFMVLNKYSNSIVQSYAPLKKSQRKVYPYFAGPRKAFKYPPHFNNESKDMPRGADSTSLGAWKPVYNTYYGLAAKLGHNRKASLKGYRFGNTEPGEGLGLIEEIEIGNEDDARWGGSLRFHNPLVKLLKLKQGYAGVKAADPDMKVISGALTGIDTSYLKAMYLANLLRFKRKDTPFDIIAVNEYATTAGGQNGGTSRGISPEQFRLYEKLQAAAALRNRYFPGKPLYLTEFGYDVHPGSHYEVTAVEGQTPEHTKATWLMRSMELAAAARWSKYYQYTQRNIPGGDFSTTGFSYDTLLKTPGRQLPDYLHPFMNENVLQNGGWTSLPKELYWHMVLRANVLKEYNAWPEIIRNGDSTGIWILRYTHQKRPNSYTYTIWLGSHENAVIKNYRLRVPGGNQAQISRAVIGKKHGENIRTTIRGNTITIPQVDETVTYISIDPQQ